MTAYFPNIKIDDYVLSLQVLHTNLSVVVMHHWSENQLSTIMRFIIFQARLSISLNARINVVLSASPKLFARSFTKLLHLLCRLTYT